MELFCDNVEGFYRNYLLKERVSSEYDDQNANLQFYIDNERVGRAVDFSSWKDEGNNFKTITQACASGREHFIFVKA